MSDDWLTIPDNGVAMGAGGRGVWGGRGEGAEGIEGPYSHWSFCRQ